MFFDSLSAFFKNSRYLFYLTMKKPRTRSLLARLIIFAPLVLLATVFIVSNQTPSSSVIQNPAQENATNDLNCSEIHWHALLQIEISGEMQTIPANIGIANGNIIDTNLTGENASPIHTHDTSGVLHIENICPEQKPETTKLGYFFTVWGEQFNKTCILNNCNNGGKTVQLNVNGISNSEFEQYKIKDGDEIEIIFDNYKPTKSLTFLPKS